MIYEYFKVSDTDESVVDFNDILMVAVKNESVQPFNTRLDDAIIAMKKKKKADDGIFGIFVLSSAFYGQNGKSIAVSVHSRYCL